MSTRPLEREADQLPFTLDASDPQFYAQANCKQAFSWIHEHGPVYYCDAQYTEPFWNVCNLAEIKAIGSDPDRFTSREGIWLGNRFQTEREGSPLPDDPRFPLEGAHTIPPADHQRQRRSVNACMIDRDAPARWQARLRTMVNQALDDIEPDVETNFVQWAHRIPLLVTTSLFGLEMDREHDFERWAYAIIKALDPGPQMDWSPIIEMLDFMDERITERRANPGDDLVSGLLQAMTDEEVRSWLWLIFTGGIETTGNLLAGGMHLLLTNPEQKQRLLDDPSLIRSATSEMLRLVSPSRYVKRNAVEDCTIHGLEIAGGDAVVMNYKVANVDPKLYPDPFRFDVTRDPSHMLAFGNGPHRCPGNVIARLEIKLAFEELLKRFPNTELAGDIVIAPTLSTVFVESLPVIYRA